MKFLLPEKTIVELYTTRDRTGSYFMGWKQTDSATIFDDTDLDTLIDKIAWVNITLPSKITLKGSFRSYYRSGELGQRKDTPEDLAGWNEDEVVIEQIGCWSNRLVKLP